MVKRALLLLMLLAIPVFGTVSTAAAPGHNILLQGNVLTAIIQFLQSLFSRLFGHITATSTSTVASTSSLATTTIMRTTATTSAPSTSTTSIRATTSSSTTLSSTTVTTVSPTSPIQCTAHDFLRQNQSISCQQVKLLLVSVGTGNERYEVSNVTVDIYLNNTLVFYNQSLLQNFTTPYQFNFSNGHMLQVYVYTAIYSYYPVNRYANISITYR